MFRFDNYCEKWAQNFKPISHDPNKESKKKAFYRMDSYDKIAELCAGLPLAKSPAMAVVTHIECDPDDNRVNLLHYTYTAYFLVKQAGTIAGRDGELFAADAKAEGHDLALKFLAWLEFDQKKNKNKELEGLDLTQASIFTAPAKYNGWWATEVMISTVVPRPLCVVADDYIKLDDFVKEIVNR